MILYFRFSYLFTKKEACLKTVVIWVEIYGIQRISFESCYQLI